MNSITKANYPEEVTQDEAKILDLVSDGQTLVKACESVGITPGAFMARVALRPRLAAVLASARDSGAEVLADSLLSIPDQEPDVNRARLKSDNVKWLLSRRHAGKYGDRLDVSISTTVDLMGALAAAKANLRPISDPDNEIVDVTPIKTTPYSGSETDTTSDDPKKSIPDFLF